MVVRATNETYIGDGVYASFDGFQIWLRTPRGYTDHEVALEPETFRNLLLYIDHLKSPGTIKPRNQNNGG